MHRPLPLLDKLMDRQNIIGVTSQLRLPHKPFFLGFCQRKFLCMQQYDYTQKKTHLHNYFLTLFFLSHFYSSIKTTVFIVSDLDNFGSNPPKILHSSWKWDLKHRLHVTKQFYQPIRNKPLLGVQKNVSTFFDHYINIDYIQILYLSVVTKV